MRMLMAALVAVSLCGCVNPNAAKEEEAQDYARLVAAGFPTYGPKETYDERHERWHKADAAANAEEAKHPIGMKQRVQATTNALVCQTDTYLQMATAGGANGLRVALRKCINLNEGDMPWYAAHGRPTGDIMRICLDPYGFRYAAAWVSDFKWVD